jgi:glycosyltransferase involved in cell wall biosynthesis
MPSDVPVVVLIPVFDDWTALSLLLPRLARVLPTLGAPVGLLIVDDGSNEPVGDALIPPGSQFAWARILRLRRNLGHQRAIAIGLCHIDEHIPCEAVIVIDGDGEDRPEDVPRLLARMREGRMPCVVFGERRRRVEGVSFRIFYLLYRLLHWVLTGRGVKVGNFSAVPRARLESLVVVSELWVHYAAAVLRSRQPTSFVPVERDRRLHGASKMNFVALVLHGLGAISVYSDVVFTRIIAAMTGLALVAVCAMAAMVGIRLFSNLAIPGWASFAMGILLVVLLQTVTNAVSLVFVILGARQQSVVIPRRDYSHYVAAVLDAGAPAR